jgi:energy-converting hydrogenase Eha subunit C
MATRSWRGIWLGAIVALAIPVAYVGAAFLLQAGVPVIVREDSTMNTLTTIALMEILLGPIGLIIVGVSIPIRHPLAWVAWLAVGVVVLAVAWFYGAVMLSGALGSPF